MIGRHTSLIYRHDTSKPSYDPIRVIFRLCVWALWLNVASWAFAFLLSFVLFLPSLWHPSRQSFDWIFVYLFLYCILRRSFWGSPFSFVLPNETSQVILPFPIIPYSHVSLNPPSPIFLHSAHYIWLETTVVSSARPFAARLFVMLVQPFEIQIMKPSKTKLYGFLVSNFP